MQQERLDVLLGTRPESHLEDNMDAALAYARVASHVATSQQEKTNTRQELKRSCQQEQKRF